MTKVSLKVTRDLTEVPTEVQNQLKDLSKRMKECSSKLEILEGSVPLGLDMRTIAGQVALQHSEMQKIVESADDLFNICKSYSEIMEESEKQAKQKELDGIVEQQVAAFNINAEAKIGQMKANEGFLVKQVSDLKSQVKKIKEASSEKPKKKITNRKK